MNSSVVFNLIFPASLFVHFFSHEITLPLAVPFFNLSLWMWMWMWMGKIPTILLIIIIIIHSYLDCNTGKVCEWAVKELETRWKIEGKLYYFNQNENFEWKKLLFLFMTEKFVLFMESAVEIMNYILRFYFRWDF